MGEFSTELADAAAPPSLFRTDRSNNFTLHYPDRSVQCHFRSQPSPAGRQYRTLERRRPINEATAWSRQLSVPLLRPPVTASSWTFPADLGSACTAVRHFSRTLGTESAQAGGIDTCGNLVCDREGCGVNHKCRAGAGILDDHGTEPMLDGGRCVHSTTASVCTPASKIHWISDSGEPARDHCWRMSQRRALPPPTHP